MSIWLGNQRLDGGSARNVGDIFYTTRTDEALAGAVECNGGTYSTADYTGAGSIGELLAGGKLDYISLTAYATAISTKGWCDKIGWNGAGTTAFRVPTLTPHIIQKNNIPVVGNNMPIYMKNELTSPDAKLTSIAQYDHSLKIQGTGGEHLNSYFSTDPTKSGIIADITDTAQLRVMFQLFNGTTDEAVATVGTVVAQVGELNSHRVVGSQIPTAANGYTWYRKYADGWVEQGGAVVVNSASVSGGAYNTKSVTFPIPLKATRCWKCQAKHDRFNAGFSNDTVTTGATVYQVNDSGASFANPFVIWEVKGMAE